MPKITVEIEGADVSDIRYDDSGDDARNISNDIYELLNEKYGYLDVIGVMVDTEDVKQSEAADFPE